MNIPSLITILSIALLTIGYSFIVFMEASLGQDVYLQVFVSHLPFFLMILLPLIVMSIVFQYNHVKKIREGDHDTSQHISLLTIVVKGIFIIGIIITIIYILKIIDVIKDWSGVSYEAMINKTINELLIYFSIAVPLFVIGIIFKRIRKK